MGVHSVLSLVTLIFDLDIHTQLSEGPDTSCVNLTQIRSAAPDTFHSRTNNKVTGNALKTEPYAVYCVR